MIAIVLIVLVVSIFSFNVECFKFLQSKSLIKRNNLYALSSETETKPTEDLFSSLQKDDNDDNISKLMLLRNERERKRIEYLASDLAVTKLETMLMNSRNNTNLIKSSYDYGYTSKSDGVDVDNTNLYGGTVPSNAFQLATKNFKKEFQNIINDFKKRFQNEENNQQSNNITEIDLARINLSKLKLSNSNIWKREMGRKQVEAPYVIKIPYYILCVLLDNLFDNKPISRFYFLETVARMPYFSYITMLHTYETLGWWRKSSSNKRIHFAEEYNEYHHLLIMESLGGDQDWYVRFLAQHSSIVYYFILILLWIVSPSLAYNFSELIEAHAVDTYAEFAESNKDLLMQMEAPKIAKDYYESLDMYVFDEFQTNRVKGSRRPIIHSLYDVFCNIRDDEQEHVNTMAACQDPNVVIKSPNTEAAIISYTLALGLIGFVSSINVDSLLSSSSLEGTDAILKNIYESVTSSPLPSNIDINTDDITSITDSTESIVDVMLKKVLGVSETVDNNVIKIISEFLSKLKL